MTLWGEHEWIHVQNRSSCMHVSIIRMLMRLQDTECDTKCTNTCQHKNCEFRGVHALCPCTSSSKSTVGMAVSHTSLSHAVLIGITRFRCRELTAFLVNVIHQALFSWFYGRESLGPRPYSLYNHSKIGKGQISQMFLLNYLTELKRQSWSATRVHHL